MIGWDGKNAARSDPVVSRAEEEGTAMSQRNRELAAYVLDQLDGVGAVRALPMMGGYLFYIEGRVFGGLYEAEELLVKITPASRRALPDETPLIPYEGSKQWMLRCPLLEDRDAFRQLVLDMLPELPEPKPKRTKNGKEL